MAEPGAGGVGVKKGGVAVALRELFTEGSLLR